MASATRPAAPRAGGVPTSHRVIPRPSRQNVAQRPGQVALPSGRTAAVATHSRATLPLFATIAVARARTEENPDAVHHWHDLAERLYRNHDFEGATLAYKRVQQLYSAQTVVRSPSTPVPVTPLDRAVARSRPSATELAASAVGRENVPPPAPAGAVMKLEAPKPAADDMLRRLLHRDLEHVMGLLDKRPARAAKKAPPPDYPVG